METNEHWHSTGIPGRCRAGELQVGPPVRCSAAVRSCAHAKKGQDDPRAKWPGKLAVDPDTLGAQRLHAVAKKADGFIVNDVH